MKRWVILGWALGASAVTAEQIQAQIASHVVISEVYGAGGNAGAVYKNDFVELYNPTDDPISLSGWSIQYGSASGTASWQVSPLSGMIAPHGFFLMQLAGGSNGIALPAPDTTGTINMAYASGKVALVRGKVALSGANPSDTTIVDRVGYGSANGYEGASPAPSPGTITSIERKAKSGSTASSMTQGGSDAALGNGWDSENNGTDLVVQSLIDPQNSSSPAEEPPKDPLPIRLNAFSAVILTPGIVQISWTTLGEVTNFGFEVQKSESAAGIFTTISALIPGHGTTAETHYYAFTDSSRTPGLFYRLKQTDSNSTIHFSDVVEATAVTSVQEVRPPSCALLQNYPNPFNPRTVISYELPSPMHVRLTVFDMLGHVVASLVDAEEERGAHHIVWDAHEVASGVYLCRFEADRFTQTRRLILVR